MQKDRVPLQGLEGARKDVTDRARTGGRQCGDKCLGEAWGHWSCAARAPPPQPRETTDVLRSRCGAFGDLHLFLSHVWGWLRLSHSRTGVFIGICLCSIR